MRKISNVGLFCCDKFEETPKQKVIKLLEFLKFYFKAKPDFEVPRSICELVLFLLNKKARGISKLCFHHIDKSPVC